jgi:dTDP-4-amino-4,6-dideoxygalactose transaminase
MLHVGKPNVLNREKFLERVGAILDAKMLTNDGPMVRELESAACELLHVKHCIAFSNATVAIELLLQELNITGEVIVPSFTFVATAHAVKRAGATPIFCDLEQGNTNGLIAPAEVVKLINERTQAIMPVNVYGNMCDVEGFQQVAEHYNLDLVYDSAHVIGCQIKNRYAGTFGRAEVFSLHATKFINAFEGGLITTNEDDLARRLKLARNFGFVTYDTVAALGTNAKLSEIHAAMGLTNLECIDQIISKNRENYELYKRYLPSSFRLMQFEADVASNYQYIVVFCDAAIRDRAVETLKQNDVFARKYFYPGVHKHAPYNKDGWQLPVTEKLSSEVICLPTGQDITESDIKRICEILQNPDSKLSGESSRDVALAGQ